MRVVTAESGARRKIVRQCAQGAVEVSRAGEDLRQVHMVGRVVGVELQRAFEFFDRQVDVPAIVGGHRLFDIALWLFCDLLHWVGLDSSIASVG